jgi:hypothetical protein
MLPEKWVPAFAGMTKNEISEALIVGNRLEHRPEAMRGRRTAD